MRFTKDRVVFTTKTRRRSQSSLSGGMMLMAQGKQTPLLVLLAWWGIHFANELATSSPAMLDVTVFLCIRRGGDEVVAFTSSHLTTTRRGSTSRRRMRRSRLECCWCNGDDFHSSRSFLRHHVGGRRSRSYYLLLFSFRASKKYDSSIPPLDFYGHDGSILRLGHWFNFSPDLLRICRLVYLQ